MIAEEAEADAQLMAESENPEFRHEMGRIPLSETKPAAEKFGEEPKERFLRRRERPPNTDPKVVEEIDKLCAEEGISFSTDGPSSTNPILADVSEEEQDKIAEWLEEEMNKNCHRSSSSLQSQCNWPN